MVAAFENVEALRARGTHLRWTGGVKQVRPPRKGVASLCQGMPTLVLLSGCHSGRQLVCDVTGPLQIAAGLHANILSRSSTPLPLVTAREIDPEPCELCQIYFGTTRNCLLGES